MGSLNGETEKQISSLVVKVLDGLSTKARPSLDEIKKPKRFHGTVFSHEKLAHRSLASSVETTIGTGFLLALAEVVARGKYSDVYREHDLSLELDSAKVKAVNNTVNNLRSGLRRPNHSEEMNTITSATSSHKTSVTITADLYLDDHEDGPLFMEIATPLSNIDQCAESKRKMLLFLAANEGKKAQAFLALTYNPYVKHHFYKWSYLKRIMDGREVLIRKELWDKLGGPGIYEAILNVIRRASDGWIRNNNKQN